MRSSEPSASEPPILTGLPGAERVARGLADAALERWTADALLIAVASGRLRALGLAVPEAAPRDAELALYERLQRDGCADPYARYNSMLRELDSFLEALEARRRREAEA